jgi:TPR repeat protein
MIAVAFCPQYHLSLARFMHTYTPNKLAAIEHYRQASALLKGHQEARLNLGLLLFETVGGRATPFVCSLLESLRCLYP